MQDSRSEDRMGREEEGRSGEQSWRTGGQPAAVAGGAEQGQAGSKQKWVWEGPLTSQGRVKGQKGNRKGEISQFPRLKPR